MRFYFYLLLLFLLFHSATLAVAQNTFIKRYKNTTLPEGSVAVCNLPDNRIAIIGQQSNGFTWQSPMIIVADSAGNQLRYFVDTTCYGCDIFDGTTDSAGFVYVVGTFYGKAGIAKYDTLGNKLWQREVTTNGEAANYSAAIVFADSLVLAGGYQNHNGSTESWLLISAYDHYGNLQWVIDSNFGNTAPEAQIGVLGLRTDSNWIYATGVSYDTLPQRAIYLKVSHTGNSIAYKELTNGRKWGYGIVPFSSDSILIGGRSDDFFGGTYSFLSLVDSLGNVRYTIQDSNSLLNNITKLDFDFSDNKMYVYDYDTIQNGNGHDFYNHIGAYQWPLLSLQQPTWEKTITGTGVSSSRGLALANDGTILHTATANLDHPTLPYLLKTDSNTCADLTTCDTAFVSVINIPEQFEASVKLYPNPVTLSSFVFIELQSDVPLQSVEVSCFDLSGRLLPIETDEHIALPNFYKVRLHTGSNLANGVYIVRLKINSNYYLNSRFVKTD